MALYNGINSVMKAETPGTKFLKTTHSQYWNTEGKFQQKIGRNKSIQTITTLKVDICIPTTISNCFRGAWKKCNPLQVSVHAETIPHW